MLKQRPFRLLLATSLLSCLALALGTLYTLHYFQLTPRQFVFKLVERSGFDSAKIKQLLAPPVRYKDHSLDGQLRSVRPRILMPELSQWDSPQPSSIMSQRADLYRQYKMDAFDACENSHILALAVCWLSSADPSVAASLLDKLHTFAPEINEGTNAAYSNGWELALAYDLLGEYPLISAQERRHVESKLKTVLIAYLAELDSDGPSLWHGRASLAAAAWLTAVSLGTEHDLLVRAQGHFLDVLRATQLTEAWPEGYNYWIQNRGLLLALAASAYVNGLESAQHRQMVLDTLHRVGLWYIYATRPDNRIEGLGDEGSRVDLKDESRRVIDVIAQLTREPVFAIYSRYLEHLHGSESYFGGYRWGFQLFNDPTVIGAEKPVTDLALVNALLPKSELFGARALNLAYIRSGFARDDTFISFKSGHTFTHHGHYDAGHFSLYKGAPLAINSSTYGEYTGENRLHYSIRSVAKNTLLILRPDETVTPNRFYKKNITDGGQRIIMPTGSTVRSLADWSRNLEAGKHYEGGKLLNYRHVDNDFTYISSDLTAAYNSTHYDDNFDGGKVSQVQRSLLYLYDEDRLLIYDQIRSTKSSYKKKWLLHTVDKPDVQQLTLLQGTHDNGILQSSASTARIQNGSGRLLLQRILPDDGVIRLLGGRDYQFYVESDGNDNRFDGENFLSGASFNNWFDIGEWRIEIQPSKERIDDEFLISLSPSLHTIRNDILQPVKVTGAARAVSSEHAIVVFSRTRGKNKIAFTVPNQQHKIYFLGLPARKKLHLSIAGDEDQMRSDAEGVLLFESLKKIHEGEDIILHW